MDNERKEKLVSRYTKKGKNHVKPPATTKHTGPHLSIKKGAPKPTTSTKR